MSPKIISGYAVITFKLLALILLLDLCACAASHKNLAPLKTGFPEEPMQLPKDLAAHEWAQTEWWYYTGHLKSKDGGRYGFELTFFRRRADLDKLHGVPLKSLGQTWYMAHFSVVDLDSGKFVHQNRIKPERKNVLAAYDQYSVIFQDWLAGGDEKSHRIKAATKKFSIDFELKPSKPPVMHGKNGVMIKTDETANYYMSYTRLMITGKLVFQGKQMEVDGLGWFDHEYGYMAPTKAEGWDWFSIQLDNNTEYMIYQIRRTDKTIEPLSKACRIDEAGREQCIPLSEFELQVLGLWQSPHTNGVYPSGWRISAPKFGLDIVIVPEASDQEFPFMDTAYWEGSCIVIGKPAVGVSYAELVGYAKSKMKEKTDRQAAKK